MNHPFARVLAAVLGGIAAMTALGALAIASSAGGGRGAGPSWAILLIVGGTVGLLAWLLLSSAPSPDDSPRRAVAQCSECGTEIFEEWRICPYCGGARESALSESEQATRLA
jgi:hypothetical protein